MTTVPPLAPHPDANAPGSATPDERRHAEATLRRALARYERARNNAEVQLAVLALHEGLRQALWAWLLGLSSLSRRQRENIEDPHSRMGELVDLARYHTGLFVGQRAAWLHELDLLLDRRNEIAHPVDDMPVATALAAATGWADLIGRLWPLLLDTPLPDIAHPDPAAILSDG